MKKVMIGLVVGVLGAGSLAAGAGPALGVAFVGTAGSSDTVQLFSMKGEFDPGTEVKVSRSGGSIEKARARATFRLRKSVLGTQVKSAGTTGDTNLTHARASAMTMGTWEFISNDGEPKRVIVDKKVDGSLRCKAPGSDPGNALASYATEITADEELIFAGSGEQGGALNFDSFGDLAGEFTEQDDSNQTIDKKFQLDLGRMKSGAKRVMRFQDVSLVSYGAGVAVDYCSSNFYRTAVLEENQTTVDNKGRLQFTPARQVGVLFHPMPFDVLNPPGEFHVYLESDRTKLLKNLKKSSFRLNSYFDTDGAVGATAISSGLVDSDGDGTKERMFTVDGADLLAVINEVEPSFFATELPLVASAYTDGKKAVIGKRVLELQ
jgi:hypothetical protein